MRVITPDEKAAEDAIDKIQSSQNFVIAFFIFKSLRGIFPISRSVTIMYFLRIRQKTNFLTNGKRLIHPEASLNAGTSGGPRTSRHAMLNLDARPSTSNGLAQDIISSETDPAGPAAVLVPDAHLLFSGNYARAGSDLVISGEDGSGHVIAGYFAHVTPPALQSPDGALLTAEPVAALAGPRAPGQYAQLGQTAGADPIGSVSTVMPISPSVHSVPTPHAANEDQDTTHGSSGSIPVRNTKKY